MSPASSSRRAKHTALNPSLWATTSSKLNTIGKIIDWKIPSVMISCLFLGIAAAVGHDLFYNYWNGTNVDTATFSQQWVSRGGTGFAFLVKMFLSVATGTAYVQQLWVMAQARPMRIEKIDSLFGVLDNPFLLCDIRLWARNLVLTALAIITWLLPIAAIATPGTLNVVSTQISPTHSLQVPEIGFANWNNYANAGFSGSLQSSTNDLYRLAVTVSSGARLAQISAPYPNTSYELDFFAPAISCQPPSDVVTAEIKSFIRNTWVQNSRCDYLAFVPLTRNLTDTLNVTIDGKAVPGTTAFPTLDYFSTDAARLFVFLEFTDLKGYDDPIVECLLKNASYKVNFDFSNAKSVQVVAVNLLNDVSTTNLTQVAPNTVTPSPEQWSYAGVMDAFGRLLAGVQSYDSSSTTTRSTLYSITPLADISSNPKKSKPGQFVPTLEGMFQNMTLSLLSNELFRKNSTDTQPVQVATPKFINLYDYQPRDLYIAYGVSVLITILCVIVGFVAILRNSASYSNNFSTVLRTTRDASFDDIVSVKDSDGADPLNHTVGDARIRMVKNPDRDRFMGFQLSGNGPI